MTEHLHALRSRLDEVPGTVSIWFGRRGTAPAFTRNEDATHYAASTMKLAVMAAAYRLAGGVSSHPSPSGESLDLDADVSVHNGFRSAAPEPADYRNDPDSDSDVQPWRRLGGAAPLRWLIRRMIVRSSNLATNLVLEHTGIPAVQEVWELTGARSSIVTRGIEDYPARDASPGLANLVTAAELAGLLAAIWADQLAGPEASAEMREILFAQEQVDDVVRGLPPGTRVAHKNGWVTGVRHSAAVVQPDDAPSFTLVTCATGGFDAGGGRKVIADVAAAAWADRHCL